MASRFVALVFLSSCLSACSFVLNPSEHAAPEAPVAAEVSFTSIVFAGQVVSPSIDPVIPRLGDQLGDYEYAWSLVEGSDPCPVGEGEEPFDRHDERNLPEGKTCVGQVWSLSVTPVWNAFRGNTSAPSVVVISDDPGTPEIVLPASFAFVTQDFVPELIIPEQNIDMGVNYIYDWQVEPRTVDPERPCLATERVLSNTSPTLPASATCVGDEWVLSVTPVVFLPLETREGEPAISEPISIEDVRPAPNLELDPSIVLAEQAFEIDVDGVQSLNNQIVQFEGVGMVMENHGSCPDPGTVTLDCALDTLPRLPTQKGECRLPDSVTTCAGQLWLLTVTPNYGGVPSTPESIFVPIHDVPANATLNVIPASPTSGDDLQVDFGELTYNYTYTDSFGSQFGAPIFEVLNEGSMWEPNAPRESIPGGCSAPTDVVPACNTEGGQTWTYRLVETVYLKDDPEGELLFYRETLSQPLSIANALPVVATAGINLMRPRVDDRVRAYAHIEDADGGNTGADFIWKAGSCASATRINGPITSWSSDPQHEVELDFSALPLSEQFNAGEQLYVEVVPRDAGGTNPAGAVCLGPYTVQSNGIEWRQRSPNMEQVPLVSFDEKNQRFILIDGTQLWEHTAALGFVQLFADESDLGSTRPEEMAHVQTLFDDTSGAERILWFGLVGSSYKLFSLDVSQRGNESWTEIAFDVGCLSAPDPRYLSSMVFDASTQRFAILGGLDQGPSDWIQDSFGRITDWRSAEAFHDGYVIALNNNGPGGAEQACWERTLDLAKPLFGATAVKHPTEANQALFFGGYTSSNCPGGPACDPGDLDPAPVQKVDLSFLLSGDPSLDYDGEPVSGERFGVMAHADPTTREVYGGVGRSRSLDSTGLFWSYTPKTPSTPEGTFTPASNTLLAEDFAYSSVTKVEDSTFGLGGRMGEGLRFYLGDFSTYQGGVSSFLNAVRDEDRLRIVEAIGDQWQVAFSHLRDLPQRAIFERFGGYVDEQRVAFGGGRITYTRFGVTYEQGHWARYNTEEERWEAPVANDEKCTPEDTTLCDSREIIGASSGASAEEGLLSIGGRVSDEGTFASTYYPMVPYRLNGEGWQRIELRSIVRQPEIRTQHEVFELGCGDAVLGVYGGFGPSALYYDTWVLEHDFSGWVWHELPTDGDATRQLPTASYDGQGYALLFGQDVLPPYGDPLMFLDICPGGIYDRNATWQTASEEIVDPVYGRPVAAASQQRLLNLESHSGTLALFGAAGSFGQPWFLKSLGEGRFEWKRIPVEESAFPSQRRTALVWDEADGRILAYPGDDYGLWEFIVREDPFATP